MTFAGARLVACGLSLGVLFASCSLFDPRDPESPTQGSASFVPPVDAATVFDNLSNAIREANTVNYLKCLADAGSFRFEASTRAAQGYGGVLQPAVWDLAHEQRYFEILRSSLPSGATMSLEIRSRSTVNLGHDSVQVDIAYRLLVPHTVPTAAKDVHGKAQFILAANTSSIWSIQRWVDIAETVNDSTWSDIKGAFGQ